MEITYKKRFDGRAWEDLRPTTAKAGVISRALGSGYFKIGNTEAYAAVYGPRNAFRDGDVEKGKIRVYYNMMPFSGSGDRVRPGGNRRSKEISMVIDRALNSVVDLKDFPNLAFDVYIELPQTDAGTRCAGICAASIALADAGIPMKDMIAGVAVGIVGNQPVVDLEYAEEAYEGGGAVADIPIAVIPSTGEIVLLQLDGEVTKEQLAQVLAMGQEACRKINKLQREAIRKRYEVSA
jgi:exosome complex component RRP41